MANRADYMKQSLPYQPRRADIEAAKFLALVARRYANENANRREVEEAIKMWQEATRG